MTSELFGVSYFLVVLPVWLGNTIIMADYTVCETLGCGRVYGLFFILLLPK
jgi:hypothetical protein